MVKDIALENIMFSVTTNMKEFARISYTT